LALKKIENPLTERVVVVAGNHMSGPRNVEDFQLRYPHSQVCDSLVGDDVTL
jgi:hypothetical protein